MPENPIDKLKEKAGLVKRPVTVPEMISAWAPQIQKALMGTSLNPDRIGRVALTAFRKNPKLGECVPESVWAAIIISAQFGLELGTEAHLIPYGKECQLVIDYKGLVQLVYRSAHIKDIEAEVVYSNDRFVFRRGTTTVLEWEPNYTDRGKPILVFAGAHTATGGYQVVVMPKDEVERIRERSSNVRNAKKWGKQTPWDTDPDEMWKKTAIRRLSKTLPRSAQDRLQQAVTLDQAAEEGGQMLRLDTLTPDGDLQLAPPPPEATPDEVGLKLAELKKLVGDEAFTAAAAKHGDDPGKLIEELELLLVDKE